ncbi:MAG: LuxR C-terminal-related transcriptional regulator [Chloroflexi bacterium]|nr:LuxR C-terminal-related transcriptional regulator [Chloroflexota bacterium]
MTDDLPPLSDREIEVLKLVATGATNQQIARALVISPNTVKVHLRNIFEKLGVQSRTEATMAAVRRGWVSVPGGQPGVERGAGSGERGGAGEQGAGEPGAAAETTVEPVSVTALVRPAVEPIAHWQRWYMLGAALLVIALTLAPGWLKGRGQAAAVSPFTDVGQPQVAPASRPAQVARWTPRSSLPEPRSRLALVADAAKLYAIGGETADGVSDQVTIYDPQANDWSAGPAKPIAVANVAAAYLDGRIYVPGGATATETVTATLEVFDPQVAAWATRSPLPAPRAAYALAAAGGKLYLFGGWDGVTYRAETFIYDPRADAWSTGAPMPRPRAFLAAATLDGLIYVVGGYDGSRELDTVAVYDPAGEGTAGGPWSARAVLGQGRGGLGLVALGTRLYAVGGGWSSSLTFNEQYDVQTAAWSRIGTPVASQWRNLGLAALGGKLYAIGGWSGSYLAAAEEYQALIRQLLPLGSRGG